jgi:hypothetical protein
VLIYRRPQKCAAWHSSVVKRHRLGSEGCLIALTPALADGKVPERVAMRDDATWCKVARHGAPRGACPVPSPVLDFPA